MKKQVQAKHIPNLAVILASIEWSRAHDRGEYGFNGWPEAPPKVLTAKLGRLADRGVLMDERGWLNTTADWTLPEAEKAAILATLDAAGHRFDAAGWILPRPEDIAEGKRRGNERARERQRLRDCKPTTLADLLGAHVVRTMDAYAADFEAYVMTGKLPNQQVDG